jgi:hypothetical protein
MRSCRNARQWRSSRAGCKRECPTGVDMARMKISSASLQKRHGLPPRPRRRLAPACLTAHPRRSQPAQPCRRWPRSASGRGSSARRQLPGGHALSRRQPHPNPPRLRGGGPISNPPQAGREGWGPAPRGRALVDTFGTISSRRTPCRRACCPRRLPGDGPKGGPRGGHCAVGGRFSPPVWSMRRGRRPGACSTRYR